MADGVAEQSPESITAAAKSPRDLPEAGTGACARACECECECVRGNMGGAGWVGA